MDYPAGYTEGESKYSIFCVKCGNRKKRNKACKKCKENQYEIEFADKSLELNNSIRTRMEELQNAEEEYRKVQEKMAALETQKNFLLKDLELRQIQLKIHEVQGKYKEHIVSDDIRKHYGEYEGKTVELETHCTIVRLDNSLEDVYFGHVTLVITYPKEVYKWHYGAEVYNKLPENLEHKFWQTYYEGQTHYDAEKTKVSYMGRFEEIPDNMTLLDIMKSHFGECITFFDNQGWPPNQIWSEDSEYESEKATDRLERLLSKSEELKKLKNKEITLSYSLEEATEKVRKYREEKRQKTKEQNMKREQEDKERRLKNINARIEQATKEQNMKREQEDSERRLKDINGRIEQATEAAPKPAELTEVVETPKQAVSKAAPKQAKVVETPKQAVSKAAPKPDELTEVVETPKSAVSKAAPTPDETSKPAVAKTSRKQTKPVETPKQAVSKAAPKPDELTEVVETPKSAVSKAAPTPDETSKPAVAKTSRKQTKPDETPKISDITEDTMVESLYKENKEKIEKDVENFLKQIEEKKDTDIKLITTELVKEETQNIISNESFKYRDRLIEKYNDLIEFFDKMILKVAKDVNKLKETDKNAQILKIENSRATLLNLKNEVDKRNILQQIEKDIVHYKRVRDQEERLLQAAYDYLKNTDTISDIERLIKYYTKFQEIILTYNSLDLSDFKPKDSAKIKSEILNFEEMIKPEQHLEKLKLLKYIKEFRDYYYSYINLKEIFVTSGQAAEYIDTTNIVFLIDFYRNIYTTQLVRINGELLKLNKKDSKKINSSILSLEKVVNANQSLKDLDILLEISNCNNNYYISIMPIEIKLHSFYRLEKEAVDIISILIKFYRSYLYISKKWSSKFSTLNEKDADKFRIVISSLNEVLNAERRLEELYIIHGHNIKAVYANLPSNYDESDEYIISNTMVLTNDIDPDIISEIITIYRRERGYCSTKLFLDNFYHKFEGKDEERKNFLIEDAKKLVNILEQRKQYFESWFNAHPTIDDNDIEKIKHTYLKYTEYTNDLIKEIQYTLDDGDESKIEILDLLTTFSIQLIDSRKRLKIE